MTPPLYTALLSASESPQACHAPAVLVSIGPTAGFNKKNSLKTTSFAFSEGYRLCRGFGVYRNFFIPATHGWRARPTGAQLAVGPEPPGAAARLARRYASNTELAALPAAADWPSLKSL
jgi:hypothetical protein